GPMTDERYRPQVNQAQQPAAARECPAAADICILDDDVSLLNAIGRLLRSAGLQAMTFNDPSALLQYAEQHQPPVVVTDILMQGMNGLAVQRKLRCVAPRTQVIVLTSNHDPNVRAEAMNAGASGFFFKPANE